MGNEAQKIGSGSSEAPAQVWLREHPRVWLIISLSVLGLMVAIVGAIHFGIRAQQSGNFQSRWSAWLNVLTARASSLELVHPQPFVTNEKGFWVANPTAVGVNGDGFRSPDFAELSNGRPTIMFTGASFAWGYSATPIGRSMVDLVRQAGYRTINLGIPASQPSHEAAIAEHYIPQLNPDVVLVLITFDNRVDYPITLQPGHPFYYSTTNGWLPGYDQTGKPLSLQEAFNENLAQISRPRPKPSLDEQEQYLRESYRRIEAAARAAGAVVRYVLVPVNPASKHASEAQTKAAALQDLGLLECTQLTPSHYETGADPHFNNEGHRVFAEFLVWELRALGFDPKPDVQVEPYPYLAAGKIDFEHFSRHFGLSPEQETLARRIINRIKDELVAVYKQPSASGPGPLVMLAQDLARGKVSAAGLGTLNEYVAGRSEAASGQPYMEVFAPKLAAAKEELLGILTPAQRYWVGLFPRSLPEINTSYDPLGEYLAANSHRAPASPSENSYTLARLVKLLELDESQREQARIIINSLKDQRADLFQKKPAPSEPAPIEVLSQLAEHEPIEAADMFLVYLSTTINVDTGEPLVDAVAQLESDATDAFTDILQAHQSPRFTAMDWPSLCEIDTGYEPVGIQLAQARPAPVTIATPGLFTLDQVKDALSLTTESASRIKTVIDNLKDARASLMLKPPVEGTPLPAEELRRLLRDDPTGAPSEFLQFMKDTVEAESGKPYAALMAQQEHDAIAELNTLLTPHQMRLLSSLGPASLCDINTGYDPISSSIMSLEPPTAASESSAPLGAQARVR